MADNTYMNTYIEEGQKQVISLKNLYDTILVGDADNPDHVFRIPISDFFVKYKDELSPYVEYYNLPESMFYKPKMVSLELYGTTELWLSLLRLNGMKNISEFSMPIIKVYNGIKLKEMINIFFKREKKIT